MRNIFLFLLAFCIAISSTAQTADSVDNIILKIPAGWQVNKTASFTQLTLFDKNIKSFCQVSVYKQQPASNDIKKDFENEWKELVEKNFTTPAFGKPISMKDKKGNSFLRYGASGAAGDGNKYFIQLNVYDCGPSIQSVLAISGTKEHLQQYDSLWQPLIAKVKRQPGNTNAPAGPVNSIVVNRWGKSENPIGAYSNDMTVNLAFSGYKRCEYNFKPDGTYTFQGENWGAKVNNEKFRLKDSKEYGLIDEIGTYQVNGNQLTVIPAKNIYRIVDGDGKIKRTESMGLAKRTYTWQTYYAIGMEETRLVLTASKINEIDGDFSTYEPAVSFPSSFCYILNRKMFFKFLPMKLAGNAP